MLSVDTRNPARSLIMSRRGLMPFLSMHPYRHEGKPQRSVKAELRRNWQVIGAEVFVDPEIVEAHWRRREEVIYGHARL